MDLDRAREFLSARFEGLEEGERIEIRALYSSSGTKTRRQFCKTPEEAAQFAATIPEDMEVYYGVNPRQGTDGTKRGVAFITCFHADVDDKHFGGDEDNALAAILDFELSPTRIVRSGYGWQAYWEFTEWLPAAVYADRVETDLRRLYLRLGGIDAVQDISRILRLPGTNNNKQATPRPVVVYQADGPRHTLEALEQYLPALPPQIVSQREVNTLLTDEDKPSLDTIRALLVYIDATTLPYEHYYLVWSAIAYYYPDQTGEDLVAEWSNEARKDLNSSPAKQPNKHRGFKRQTGRVATLGTIIHYAKLGGYVPPQRPLNLISRGRRPGKAGYMERLADLPDPAVDDLPYWLGQMYEYIGDLADAYPRDMITFSALTFLSQCFPRVRFENLPANLWLNIIMEQGSGKNAITDAMYEVTKRIEGIKPTLYTSGSAEGMFKQLVGEGKQLFAYLGEFGEFLAAFSKDYMRGARGTMCNLYDGRDVSHLLSRSEVQITSPYMTMVGTTTPQAFMEYVTEQDLVGGFASRFLYCAPWWINKSRGATPTIAAATELAARITEHIAHYQHVTNARWDAEPGISPASYKDYERMCGVGSGDIRTLDDAINNPLAPKGRHLARVKKMAADLELLERRPQIDGDTVIVRDKNADLAVLLVRRGEIHQDWSLSYVSSGEDERALEKIRRLLVRKPEGVTRAQLMQYTHLRAEALRRLLPILEESGDAEPFDGTDGRSCWRMPGLPENSLRRVK